MSDERPYPPSDQKLAKLRAEGIFARTPEFFVFCSVAIVLFVVLWFGKSGAHAVRELFEDQFRKAQVSIGDRDAATLWTAENLHALLGAVVRFCALPLAVALFIVIAAGLIQSRFLLLAPRFDFGRVLRGFAPGMRSARLRASTIQLLQFGALLGLGYLAMLSLVAALTGTASELVPSQIPFEAQLKDGAFEEGIAAQGAVLKIARAQISAASEKFKGSVGVLTAFAALLAVVCRFASVLSFRRSHGMSREELQAELRESEASPEMRDAIRDLRTGD